MRECVNGEDLSFGDSMISSKCSKGGSKILETRTQKQTTDPHSAVALPWEFAVKKRKVKSNAQLGTGDIVNGSSVSNSNKTSSSVQLLVIRSPN